MIGSKPYCELWVCGRDAPNRIPNVIGNQQRSGLVDSQSDRASTRMSVGVEEAGDDIFGFAVRMAAAEWHEHDFVAVEGGPVPASMFTDERPAAILLRKTVRRVESKPERRNVRAQRIIGNNRLLDQIRSRRLHARIDVL